MRKIYITILIIVVNTVYCQNKATEKADQLFESYQYVDAIKEYQKLSESKNESVYVYEQLGNCYFIIFDNEKALNWYSKAVEGKASAETYYRYAQTLKSFGKYEEANKQMDVFAKLLPNDERARKHKLNPNYIPSLFNTSSLFTISETNINVKDESDFGAFLTNDNELYFVSTRNTSNKKDRWNDQYYLDIFKTQRKKDGTFEEANLVKELNTPFHDGPVTISQDGNTIYFARDGLSEGKYEVSKNKTKIGQQGLYKAVKIEGKWEQIEALPFNSINYSVTCPSLSKDGKTLYFSSNMPGGIGQSDIWKVAIEANGYGKPENLGDKINTSDRENFPFITEDNILYFASSGKQGYGAYDIFKINLSTSEAAVNLGKPINSEKDDFSFSFNKLQDVGYFSSNRSGLDAIYTALPICKANSIVTVIDKKSGQIIANAIVNILDTDGNILSSVATKADGKVTFDLQCNTDYLLKISAANYEDKLVTISKIEKGEISISASLTPFEVIITETEVILKNVYFDFNKSNITSQGAAELDKLVKVMKENSRMVIFVKSHTDSKGSASYNLKLSEQRAQSTVQYIISKGIESERISGKGFGSSEPKILCGKDCTEEQHSQNRRSEFVIIKK
jgi:outer membrane protein OmpA-like peptidoglycan-associated protein/tetratricopeptide (TPR) repeat protein